MKKIRETSTFVAKELIKNAEMVPYLTVLEPSAGSGKIIDTFHEMYPDEDNEIIWDCIELNLEKCQLLHKKGYNVSRTDFLKYEFDKKYDRIVAAPPFINNSDVLHIQKMYTHLKEGGIISSLTSPFWLTNNEVHQIEFRKWLEDKDYKLIMLPDNSFIEKNKTVPTAIIIIKK